MTAQLPLYTGSAVILLLGTAPWPRPFSVQPDPERSWEVR